MVATKSEADSVARFADRYRQCCAPVRLSIETSVIGADYGSTGYTTLRQADLLAEHLNLGPGDRLADVGAGSGWPGLYLAGSTGCTVVGTDLPLDGLQRARARASADGLEGRAAFAVATGRHQPFRPGAFDAVVHTDVLCCLGPKLAVLRSCRRLLRPGGRTAFTTIHLADGLDRAEHRRAVLAGPPHVTSRRPYRDLVAQAGFSEILEIDVTRDYAATQRAWLEHCEANGDELRRVTSDADFALEQRKRRRAAAAIGDGLLRRALFVATAP